MNQQYPPNSQHYDTMHTTVAYPFMPSNSSASHSGSHSTLLDEEYAASLNYEERQQASYRHNPFVGSHPFSGHLSTLPTSSIPRRPAYDLSQPNLAFVPHIIHPASGVDIAHGLQFLSSLFSEDNSSAYPERGLRALLQFLVGDNPTPSSPTPSPSSPGTASIPLTPDDRIPFSAKGKWRDDNTAATSISSSHTSDEDEEQTAAQLEADAALAAAMQAEEDKRAGSLSAVVSMPLLGSMNAGRRSIPHESMAVVAPVASGSGSSNLGSSDTNNDGPVANGAPPSGAVGPVTMVSHTAGFAPEVIALQVMPEENAQALKQYGEDDRTVSPDDTEEGRDVSPLDL